MWLTFLQSPLLKHFIMGKYSSFQLCSRVLEQVGVLEYVLQYYDLISQRNHIFNRNAFSSLILCYLYVSRKPLRKSPYIVCIMAFCQIRELD